MKKFIVEIQHIEYAALEIEAKNEQEAEDAVFENLDYADWGNDETDIIGIEESKENKK